MRRTDANHAATVADSDPLWWRPGFLLLGLGCLALVCQHIFQPDQWWVPAALITASGLVVLPAIYRSLRGSAEQVLSDHLLVLAGAYILYYVCGALLVPLGPQDQVDYVLSFYVIDASLATRVTAVNCIGFGLALVVGTLTGRRWVSITARLVLRVGRFPPEWVIGCFLLVGAVSSIYAFVADLDLQIVSGTVRSISQLPLVAIMAMAAYQGRRSRLMMWSAVALSIVDAGVGLMLFNKSAVMMPLAALLGGLGWRFGMRRILVPGLAAMMMVLVAIGEPVSTARNTNQSSGQIDWRGRGAFMWNAVWPLGPDKRDGNYYSWVRFCYLPPQGAAMDLFDRNQGGDDYLLAGWVLLPRMLFPNKPIITQSGPEFHYKITGHDTSSTGQGLFVNGYYNMGWWGVLLVGSGVGAMLAWTSAFASEVYRQRSVAWLPLAFVGTLMAFRIDGHFLADYAGTFVILGYVVAAGALTSAAIGGVGDQR